MKNLILPRIVTGNEKRFKESVQGLMAFMQEALILHNITLEDEYYNSTESTTVFLSETIRGLSFHIVCDTKKKMDIHVREDGNIFIFFLFFNFVTGKWENFETWSEKTTSSLEKKFNKILKLLK